MSVLINLRKRKDESQNLAVRMPALVHKGGVRCRNLSEIADEISRLNLDKFRVKF